MENAYPWTCRSLKVVPATEVLLYPSAAVNFAGDLPKNKFRPEVARDHCRSLRGVRMGKELGPLFQSAVALSCVYLQVLGSLT